MEEEKKQEKTTSQEVESVKEESAIPEATGEISGSSNDREMHKATCTDCGTECEVPFKPTEGKPVRCQDCFRKNRPRKSFGGGRRDNFRRERTMHDATCGKCKQKCQVPFKPSGDRPVLCRDCYRKEKGF